MKASPPEMSIPRIALFKKAFSVTDHANPSPPVIFPLERPSVE